MSDSSSEENIEQLREAVNNEFIADSLFNKKENIDTIAAERKFVKREKRPSIRAQLGKEQECHPLNVTPEFQNFVAKHLSRILDRQLEEVCQDCTDSQCAPEDHISHVEGVRLFGSSTSYITIKDLESSNKEQKQRQRIVRERDSEEKLEKFQGVSVSSDWVLSKKGIEGWEKPSKGEIMIINNNGELVAHENAKRKIRTNSRGVREREFHITV